jgi:tRNA pseudouridine55 synthase
MNGILIIDKPQGMTSHAVVSRVRRLFNMRKVGHAGTLDPLATGLLIVALGQGTRILQFLMEETKAYRATLKLGEATDTQDAEGTVVTRESYGHLSLEAIAGACRAMQGAIEQIPPMYSALKKDGVPLYRLARKGMDIERAPRQVHIETLELLDIAPPRVTFDVQCSKGTYVRTLCHDIGLRLGCGAHLTALRRIRSGPFLERDAVSLADLEEASSERRTGHVLTLREALHNFPALTVEEEQCKRLIHGIPPELSAIKGPLSVPAGELVLLTNAEQLLAIARFAPLREREQRGDFELLKVFNRAEGA